MVSTPLLLVLAMLQTPPDPAKLLGGPCADPPNHELVSKFHRQFNAAMEKSDFARAAEIGPQLVRAFCGNNYLWWKYAEALVQAGRLVDAVAVLEYLFPRDDNDAVYQLTRPGNRFAALTASREFRESLPGRRLAQILLEAEQRRSEARARLAGMARPPEAYIAKEICPFECCHYGQWKVTRATALLDAPGGRTVVARLRPGETIEALDGEVHLKPAAVLVRRQIAPEAPFPEGAIVFLVGYTGEGWGRVWYEGREVGAEVSGASVYCPSPGPVCWGEFIDPADRGWAERAVWWIRIKAPNGRIGWTSESRNFSGADGCG